MKFEGKTFYLYVSQKEVSALPSRGTSRAQPWPLLPRVPRCTGQLQWRRPVPALQGHGQGGRGRGSVAALGSPPCSRWHLALGVGACRRRVSPWLCRGESSALRAARDRWQLLPVPARHGQVPRLGLSW